MCKECSIWARHEQGHTGCTMLKCPILNSCFSSEEGMHLVRDNNNKPLPWLYVFLNHKHSCLSNSVEQFMFTKFVTVEIIFTFIIVL